MYEINEQEYEFALTKVAEALSQMRGGYTEAFLQIDMHGNCILQIGKSTGDEIEHLSIAECARKLASTGIGRYGT